MIDDTSPDHDPEFESDAETLPAPGPLRPDTYGESDPRIADQPLPQDYGIPGIDVDRYGWLRVPRPNRPGLKADNCLVEQAQNEFFMGMGLDELKSIAWLWPGRIPVGKLTLIEGESNSGTSFLVTDLAARVTRGMPWPGAAAVPPQGPANLPVAELQSAGNLNSGEFSYTNLALQAALSRASRVMFINGGDNVEDTVTPRLARRGANLHEVTVISRITTHDPVEMRKGKAETQRRLVLPADLGHIEYQLRMNPDTRLVVVDSLSDLCQTDKQFRETVRGLHEMAERCNVAVVATARPKNDRRARGKLVPSADRRSESVRCVLNVLVDPHDRSLRYLAPARMNFCAEPKWIGFRIGDGVVEWGQELEAAPVYQRNSPADQEKTTLLSEAMECLKGTLADCDLPAEIAIQQVMDCGFSRATVIRARRALGVRSVRKGFGPRGSWLWTLKPAGSGTAAGNGHENGHTNGAGENGHAGDLERNGSHGEHESSQEDDLEGFDFDHMPRELVLESLNYLRALESAAKDGTRPNGKLGKNGKPSKNGKRKPR